MKSSKLLWMCVSCFGAGVRTQLWPRVGETIAPGLQACRGEEQSCCAAANFCVFAISRNMHKYAYANEECCYN